MSTTTVKQTFARNGIALDEQSVTLLQTICTDASITSTELYCKWEAWALANNASTNAPTLQDLSALKAHIETQARTPAPHRKRVKSESTFAYPAGPTPTRITIDDFFSYADFAGADDAHLDAPKPEPIIAHPAPIPEVKPEPVPTSPDAVLPSSAPDAAYSARTGSGRAELSYNIAAHDDLPPSTDLSLQITPVTSTERMRYMNDQIPLKISSVRAHTKHISEMLLKSLAERDVPLPPCVPEAFFSRSSQPVLAVGRIRVELDGSEGVLAGRINPNSVLLESEDGNMVKLDLARVQERQQPLFLAPGMVVAVEGVNTNERVFEVHNVYDNAMNVVAARAKEEQTKMEDEEMKDDDHLFVSAIFAAGPFTTSANLSYEPLEDLLQIVERDLPQLVILTGPFMDVNHSEISECTAASFDTIFETKILVRLRQAVSDITPAPHFIIVPSLDDVHHDPVCPQPPFEWPEGQMGVAKISLLSNPSVLRVSSDDYSVSIGVSSLPSLQDISADCVCWNKGDRFSAIVSHMLRQRSFYPCFPPSPAVPLDTTHLARIAIPDLPNAPTVDVIFTPSKLKAFIKSVDGGAVAINPGLLCRGSSGGTYAELRIPLHKANAPKASSDANEVRLQGNIIRV